MIFFNHGKIIKAIIYNDSIFIALTSLYEGIRKVACFIVFLSDEYSQSTVPDVYYGNKGRDWRGFSVCSNRELKHATFLSHGQQPEMSCFSLGLVFSISRLH